MTKEFQLNYWISNNGDGSASARFVQTKEEAEKEDEEQSEGWGEPCASSIRLKVEDGVLYFREYKYDETLKKYIICWTPVPEIS